MISDIRVAQKINELALRTYRNFDASVAEIQAECDLEEAARYRSAVAKVLGEMLCEILNPLYEQHPSLKPTGLL